MQCSVEENGDANLYVVWCMMSKKLPKTTQLCKGMQID